MQSSIVGTTMPVLEFVLEPNESVISEAGELSWMTSSIQMTTHTQLGGGGGIFGAIRRVAGGGTLFMTEYRAAGARGELAFATQLPGHIVPVEVSAGPRIHDSPSWLSLRHAADSNRCRVPAIARRRHLRRRRLPAAAPQRTRHRLARAFRRTRRQRSSTRRNSARPSRPRRRFSVECFVSNHHRSRNQEHNFRRRRTLSSRSHRTGPHLAANPPHFKISAQADGIHAQTLQRGSQGRGGRRHRWLYPGGNEIKLS